MIHTIIPTGRAVVPVRNAGGGNYKNLKDVWKDVDFFTKAWTDVPTRVMLIFSTAVVLGFNHYGRHIEPKFNFRYSKLK